MRHLFFHFLSSIFNPFFVFIKEILVKQHGWVSTVLLSLKLGLRVGTFWYVQRFIYAVLYELLRELWSVANHSLQVRLHNCRHLIWQYKLNHVLFHCILETPTLEMSGESGESSSFHGLAWNYECFEVHTTDAMTPSGGLQLLVNGENSPFVSKLFFGLALHCWSQKHMS